MGVQCFGHRQLQWRGLCKNVSKCLSEQEKVNLLSVYLNRKIGEKTAKNGAAMGMTLAHNPLAQGPHTPAQACTSLPKAFVNTHLTTHHTRSQFAAAVASTHHTRGHFAAVLPASSGVGRVPTLLLPTSVSLGADVRIYACTQHAPCSDHGCVSGARFSPLVATSSKVHRALVATSTPAARELPAARHTGQWYAEHW
jgi:hypothetical protein